MRLSLIGATLSLGARDPRTAAGPDDLRRQGLSPLLAKRLGLKEPPSWTFIRPLDEAGVSVEMLKIHFLRQLEAQCRKEMSRGNLPIVLSADHQCAQATLGAAAKRSIASSQSFGAVWMNSLLDAHSFVNTTPPGEKLAPALEILLNRPSLTKTGSAALDPAEANNLHLATAPLKDPAYQAASFTDSVSLKSAGPLPLPLIEAGRLCVFGTMPAPLETEAGQRLFRRGAKWMSQSELQLEGVARGFQESLRFLSRSDVIALSMDLNVLDPLETPLADGPAGTGLRFFDLLSAARASARRMREPYSIIEISGYNPLINPKFSSGEALAELIAAFLGH